jgi:hypothetical protein
MLPPDHPHTQQRALGQIHNPPSTAASPRKSKDVKESKPKGLNKKTLSSMSLRSLGKDKDKEEKKSRELSRAHAEKDIAGISKKDKTSTNLAAVFQKSKTSKEDKRASQYVKDKENTTPPGSAVAPQVQTPIWAQFSSQLPFQEVRSTTTIPLNDRRSIEQEIALYTPTEYSPSKQHNFTSDYGEQPSLQKRPVLKERPKSSFLPSSGSTANFMESLSRKISGERAPLSATKGNGTDANSRGVKTRSMMMQQTSSEGCRSTDAKTRTGQTVGQKGNRVMAAVAVFNGKAKDAGVEMSAPLSPKVVDEEFEAVLVCIFHQIEA